MAPFEAMYGKQCRSQIGWFDSTEMDSLDTDLLKDALEKYVSDESHVLSFDSVILDPDLSFEEQPIAILDRQDKEISNSYFNSFIESEMLSLVKLCIWFVCTGFRTNPEGPFGDLRVWLLCCYLVCLALVRGCSLSRVSLPRGTGRVCEGLASFGIRVRECLAVFTTFVLAKGESQK
ncbi:hypothetical protein MTR67_043009 [Solanum verrucosum]|uniref:Uncharacterized protein n=1 Tax=Solanum verrucosum TaxID=315347 RepID=A0AAF0ZUQ1_SOLVR|nr:hypothetical protein MTR67_043009 [Solanum verrucosum]